MADIFGSCEYPCMKRDFANALEANDDIDFDAAASAFPDISLDGEGDIPSATPAAPPQTSSGFSFDDFDSPPQQPHTSVKVTGDDEIEKFENEFPDLDIPVRSPQRVPNTILISIRYPRLHSSLHTRPHLHRVPSHLPSPLPPFSHKRCLRMSPKLSGRRYKAYLLHHPCSYLIGHGARSSKKRSLRATKHQRNAVKKRRTRLNVLWMNSTRLTAARKPMPLLPTSAFSPTFLDTEHSFLSQGEGSPVHTGTNRLTLCWYNLGAHWKAH